MNVTVEIIGSEIKIIDDADGMIFIDYYQAEQLRDQLAEVMNQMAVKL